MSLIDRVHLMWNVADTIPDKLVEVVNELDIIAAHVEHKPTLERIAATKATVEKISNEALVLSKLIREDSVTIERKFEDGFLGTDENGEQRQFKENPDANK